jgi:hypothetical protein
MGSSEYRSAVFDLKDITRVLFSSQLDVSEPSYRDGYGGLITDPHAISLTQSLVDYGAILNRLEAMRRVDQKKLLDFADYLKNREGQKYVYMFYQREYIPTIDPVTFHRIMTKYLNDPSVGMMTTSLFGLYRRDVTVDVEKVKRAYADSSWRLPPGD